VVPSGRPGLGFPAALRCVDFGWPNYSYLVFYMNLPALSTTVPFLRQHNPSFLTHLILVLGWPI
jgi:hypothetical protein